MVSAIENFVLSATEHGRFTLQGNPSMTNAAYRGILEASQALRASADEGDAAFSLLLDHSDAAVRTWAAYYLLPIKEEAAKRTLAAIAAGTDLIAFGAEVTLLEWNAGRLKIL